MLRLTGGEFRGRSIETPPEKSGKAIVRPTQAKLRQALFNSIQMAIPDAKVLDLFAGSGALGFEALSRGAAHVTFIEDARLVIPFLSKNAATLKVEERVEIIQDSVANCQKRVKDRQPFDVVLADPPYEKGWEPRLLAELDWSTLLVPEGIFCLEWGALKSQVSELPESTPFLVKIREKNYGDSILTTYRRKGDVE
jgi:16S rRNA (guanine966-N2)-methyltransferase